MPWMLRTNDFKKEILNLEIVPCTKNELVILSFKKLALFWGLAICSVFIPVLHFVLVPSFLIVGVVAFMKQYKNTHLIKGGIYICPECKRDFEMKPIYFMEGKKIDCSLCGTQLSILPAE
ncbi:MAG: hypothetical protein ACXVAX_01875 [Pseudobdellovibrio sp.]